MGIEDSKPVRISAETREEREKKKHELTENRKAQLDAVQQSILSSTSALTSTSTSVVSRDAVNLIKITDKAKSQLDRGGNALTKADLVAIVIALQPEMRPKLAEVENMTTSDLNCMIRSVVYDPTRVIPTRVPQPLPQQQTGLSIEFDS